jgi:probable F420-dependent oxidoreductase
VTAFGYALSSEEHGPRDLVANARAAEEAGFSFALISDHFHPWIERHPHSPFVWGVLGAIAQATEKLVVGTSVCLVIEHDPIVLAKQISSLQNLSGGRFVFGVGAGWNKPEMRNHGTDPATRHGNMRERVEAIKAIWAEDEAEYHGKHVNFDPIWQWPKPDPAPPVYVGGNGPRVEDRVLRYADGWMPNMKEIETLAPRIAALRERAGRHVPVTYYGATPGNLDVLREAGVDRALIVLDSVPEPSIPSLG